MLVIFLKKLCDVQSGIKGVFRGGKTSLVLSGNIPELKAGMAVDVTVSEHDITAYEVPKSAHNQKLLGAKAEKFYADIVLHKQTGLRWRDLPCITGNPYNLYRFEEADRVFKALGKEGTDPMRLAALVREVRSTLRAGRRWQMDMDEYVTTFRGIEGTGAYEHLPIEQVIQGILDERFDMDGTTVCDSEIRLARQYRRGNISRRNLSSKSLLSAEEIESFLDEADGYTEEQKRVVRSLISTRPAIVTGGAGVGKTSTIKLVIDCFKHYRTANDICLLAPTGRASRRMTECTGLDAKTIHSGLRKTPESEYVYYGESRKLPYRLYIIDESSMIDDLLMSDLLKAIPDDAKIYLVGDYNQLYPVGVGEPFHEMIQNGECEVALLTKNFRQSSDGRGIRINAERILKGEPLESDIGFTIEHIGKDDILRYATEDTLSISPYNELNSEINNHLIGNRTDDRYLYFAGEKVIAIRNTASYCNGDLGTISHVTQESIDVKFDDKTVTVSRKEFSDILPAYSLTVHKCQGSEFDAVNLFLPEQMTDFITKRLVYTAITRARKHVNLYMYK